MWNSCSLASFLLLLCCCWCKVVIAICGAPPPPPASDVSSLFNNHKPPLHNNLNNNNNLSPVFVLMAHQVLDRMPVIDGHNDFGVHLPHLIDCDLRRLDFDSELSGVEPWASCSYCQTDLPRLRRGRVGAQFWGVFVYKACKSSSGNSQDSLVTVLRQIDVLKRLAAKYPQDLQFATSATGIEEAIGNKRIATLLGLEGGHLIQSSAAVVRQLYELGIRYLSLTHNCNTPWADSNLVDATTDDDDSLPATNQGLSDFGLEIIDELNRLGMMIDLSHASEDTVRAALTRTKAPVIFSHSNAKAICNHHRNVADELLLLLKKNNGIIMVNFAWKFVQCDAEKNGTLWDVVDHIQHIKNLIGADHIGLGGDYDGMPKFAQGLEDVSTYPNLFAALLQSGGWREDELEKLAGRNLLRVFHAVEEVRDSLQGSPPMETWLNPPSS